MAIGRIASLALSVLSMILCIVVLSADPPTTGFKLSLIHRDSLNSHISNHNGDNSRFALARSVVTRSIARANRISSKAGLGLQSESDPEADIFNYGAEYIMNISIGTPPFPILADADTGSDLIWTQCKPCSKCYEQEAPLFDSTKSSTYKPVPCSAPQCQTRKSGFKPSCDSSNKCGYSVRYGDGSTSYGTVATETITLGSSKFTNFLFGCGFNNQGLFSSYASGIIGLGNGPQSLIGQIDKEIGGKFSYCLIPLSDDVLVGSQASDINFGKNAAVLGHDVVSTPLVEKSPETFYYVTLEAISIGDVRVPYTASDSDYGFGGRYSRRSDAGEKGNFIIDSGTNLFIMPTEFYSKVEAEIAKQVKAKRVGAVEGWKLCFEAKGFEAPEIVVHFEGADVKLSDYNAFFTFGDSATCFGSIPSNIGIYGNMAQMNFLVGFDKVKKRVSFKRTDCTRYKD